MFRWIQTRIEAQIDALVAIGLGALAIASWKFAVAIPALLVVMLLFLLIQKKKLSGIIIPYSTNLILQPALLP